MEPLLQRNSLPQSKLTPPEPSPQPALPELLSQLGLTLPESSLQSPTPMQSEPPPQSRLPQPGPSRLLPTQNIRRTPARLSLSTRKQRNPSSLVANIIAHQEQVARQQTFILSVSTPRQRQPEEEVQKPSQTVTQLTKSLRWKSLFHKGVLVLSHPAKSLRWKSLFHKRVPVLLQMSAIESGAACLAMILRYYGRRASVSEISEYTSVGRDGLSALDIAKTARDYGLDVRAISIDGNDLQGVKLPAIVRWQFNRFLIVERWSPASVDVVDPASGFKRITTAEFNAGFTGGVIMLEPGKQFVRFSSSPAMTVATYVIEYIKRAPMVLAQIIAASLILQIVGLLFPFLIKEVVNEVIPFKASDILPLIGIGIIVIVLMQLITTLLRALLLVYLQTRIDARIMPAFFKHLLMLPQSFFQKRSNGDILTRIEGNSIVRDMISGQVVSAFLDGGLIMFSLFVLFTRSSTFGCLALVIALLHVVILLCSNRPMRDLNRHKLEVAGKIQGYVAEILTGITTIKASGAEQRAFTRWSSLFFDQLNITTRLDCLSSMITSFIIALNTLAPLILLWIGTMQVLNGTMRVGTMLSLNALAISFLTPVASLARSGLQLQTVQAHLELIADVLDVQPEQDIQYTKLPPRLTGKIFVDHVSFRYDAHSPYILKDISLDIEPGQKIAIVGRIASGKSTFGRPFANCLARWRFAALFPYG